MQVIKDFTPLEALEYCILLLMCYLVEEIPHYNECVICVKERQEAQSFSLVILNKFHSNYPFTVYPHLTFCIYKYICQHSPKKMFKTTATEAKLIIEFPPSLELHSIWSFHFTKWLHDFTLDQDKTSTFCCYTCFQDLCGVKMHYNTVKEDHWNLIFR